MPAMHAVENANGEKNGGRASERGPKSSEESPSSEIRNPKSEIRNKLELKVQMPRKETGRQHAVRDFEF